MNEEATLPNSHLPPNQLVDREKGTHTIALPVGFIITY